ncbi:hypothetical protein L6Q79_15075 [bacterium]|nr:hypothetical protein [bacterium]NUN47108.1 hypothetical protein [bacterium]
MVITSALLTSEDKVLRILSSYARFAEKKNVPSLFFNRLTVLDERFLHLTPFCSDQQQKHFDHLMKLLIKNATNAQGAWHELYAVIEKGHMLGLHVINFRNVGNALLSAIKESSDNHCSDAIHDAWMDLITQILKRVAMIETDLGISVNESHITQLTR